MFWDQSIKEGDGVMVVRDCCGRYLGRVFKVMGLGFQAHPNNIRCDQCGREYSNMAYARSDQPKGALCNAPMHWLKKLPPVAELEGVKTEEEIHA